MDEKRPYFESLYSAWADSMFRFALARTGSRALAMDIIHDVFVSVWDYIDRGGTIENEKSFLMRAVKNKMIDYGRKKKTSSLEEMSESGFDPEDHYHEEPLEKEAKNADLQKALSLLKELPEREREILILHFVEGMAVKEIADVVNERANTISVIIHRSVKKIREMAQRNI